MRRCKIGGIPKSIIGNFQSIIDAALKMNPAEYVTRGVRLSDLAKLTM